MCSSTTYQFLFKSDPKINVQLQRNPLFFIEGEGSCCGGGRGGKEVEGEEGEGGGGGDMENLNGKTLITQQF